MPVAQYIGIAGVAREVNAQYIGVGGVAREVEKGLIGVNNVARLFYQKQDRWQRYSIAYSPVYTQSSSQIYSTNYSIGSISAGSPWSACYGTGYTFNSATGQYTITGIIDTDTVTGFNGSGQYYFFDKVFGQSTTEAYYFAAHSGSSLNSTFSNIYYIKSGYRGYALAYNSYSVFFTPGSSGVSNYVNGTHYNSTSSQVAEQGEYIDTVRAAPGTYPDNGISGDYWYVKI